MDVNKFYHFDKLFYRLHCKDGFEILSDALVGCCLNDNPIARLVFNVSRGVVSSDLDISVSPDSDPAVRAFVEQLRTELPVTYNTTGLSDEDLFKTVIPNNAQFGSELNGYIDNLRQYVIDNLPSEKGGD